MLTISRLTRWSIRYYTETADAAKRSAMSSQAANGGLGEYYSEADTRIPHWLLTGDRAVVADLVGLDAAAVAGGVVDSEVATGWLDDGVAPNGVRGRAFTAGSVHGFDLTFAAPKSVSLIRALTDPTAEKVLLDAHERAIASAMDYLHQHAGYTRVHNPVTGCKDLHRLPGLAAMAYQHETSRCGDPHLHTHVIVPNRQPRADGVLVSIDSKSLYHEAKAAGMIYQATLRHILHTERGLEWAPVDPHSGMAEIAGITRNNIVAWSRRSTVLREWAADNLVVVDGEPTAAQLAAAQKATRPAKPEGLAWVELQEQWRADERGLRLDREAHFVARADRERAARARALGADDRARIAYETAHGARGAARGRGSIAHYRARSAPQNARPADEVARPHAPGALDRGEVARMCTDVDKAAFTRADMVEHLGARLPVDAPGDPREVIERWVGEVIVPLSAPRAAHHREGHERFTTLAVMAEESAILDLVDAAENTASLDLRPVDVEHLSVDQARAVAAISTSPMLVQPLSAPAGAGKTHSLGALRAAAHRARKQVLVCAPTGKAVDEALTGGAGDRGLTVAKALHQIADRTLELDRRTVLVVDEAAMVATPDLHGLIGAAVEAKVKIVLVGDSRQLSPVLARGGMFEQLCAELPWTQRLSQVWRMHDPDERAASLALRDGRGRRLTKAVHWYRTHDRLHTGDQVAMATDALAAYHDARIGGRDALLVCDTWEIADAFNRRLHDHHAGDKSTVTGARGQLISAGDVIISRANDPTIGFYEANGTPSREPDQVRNGNRWTVVDVNPDLGRLAAVRLSDGARVVFDGDYLREHVGLGYAVTVHSAQGVTTDTSLAVMGDNASRAMAYVALTRGRHDNQAFIYQRDTTEADHRHTPPITAPEIHQLKRGGPSAAAQYLRSILANDERLVTLHDAAESTKGSALPFEVDVLLRRNAERRGQRSVAWRALVTTADKQRIRYARWAEQAAKQLSREHDGLEL